MTDKTIHLNSVSRRTGPMAYVRLLALAFLVMGGMATISTPATAQSLDAARAAGMIGEKADGYAVARGSATAAVRSLVSRVNSQRGKIYAKRARQQKISVGAVGKLYAGQIAGKAPKGTWIQSASGAWRRK